MGWRHGRGWRIRLGFLTTTRAPGTHTQPLLPDGSSAPLKPTGAAIRNGTEAASVIWTPDRKIKCASGPP